MNIKETLQRQTVCEFLRFCIVGVISTGIDTAVFYSVLQFAPYPVALVTGYCISLVVNFLLTMYWTFKKKPSVHNTLAVVGAHLFNLFVVRMGLMFLFVDIFDINEQIAYLPTLVISVFTNFLIVRFAVNKY